MKKEDSQNPSAVTPSTATSAASTKSVAGTSSDHGQVSDFVLKALNAGIPVQSLVGLLTAHGWTEKEAHVVLADHYRRQTGIEVPRRPGSGASARDAFFYLLIFSTLAVWTLSLGSLAFSLIDRWLTDPLFRGYGESFNTYTVTTSLAALIVAFPLYLFISRVVIHEAAMNPEKLDSAVRKWLTYMALVIAASVFMGDLIAALAYLLRGELTSRFLAKSVVVLILSSGVFCYYFGGLRKIRVAAFRLNPRLSRDRLMALVSTAAVIVMVVLGFVQLGAPSTQRKLVADGQRIQRMYLVSSSIRDYWKAHASQLPASLDQLPGTTYADPVTHAAFEYRPEQGSRYQLCAVFADSSSREDENQLPRVEPNPWTHPAGRYCFSLDASAFTQAPAYNYY
ncbi:MAG TPA: DUF5671 domain-containing protein [Terracidiphilus sp.]|nr:DUF5671 domain-containing protein [Terracidiphilus sp.]